MAPPDHARYLKVYYLYEPVGKLLTPEARQKATKGNYQRLFGAARTKVRAWEAANVGKETRLLKFPGLRPPPFYLPWGQPNPHAHRSCL